MVDWPFFASSRKRDIVGLSLQYEKCLVIPEIPKIVTKIPEI